MSECVCVRVCVCVQMNEMEVPFAVQQVFLRFQNGHSHKS